MHSCHVCLGPQCKVRGTDLVLLVWLCVCVSVCVCVCQCQCQCWVTFDAFGVHLLIGCCIVQGASGAEMKASCTEAGMFALRERRIHVTQEDFEMAVAKVMKKDSDKNMSLKKLWK